MPYLSPIPPKEFPYDVAYEQELYERFRAWVPEKIFDAHFHLSYFEIPGVSEENAFDALVDSIEDMTGKGRLAGGLLMGNPADFTDEELEYDRAFGCKLTADRPGFVYGLVVRPWDDPDKVNAWIEKNPQIAALKPYRSYARVPDTFEADILDYAPEWMWEIAEHWGLAVKLHLSHYGDMLRDPANWQQIRMLSAKYPHTAVDLAHCAMGHHPDKFLQGLPHLEGLPNVWMDCSGISEALTLIYAIRYFGTKHLTFGTDSWHFAQMPGRVMSMGGDFLGMRFIDRPEYDAAKLMPPDYHYAPLSNLVEGMLAFWEAAKVCGLSESEREDIFYNNAAGLYYPRTRR